MFLTALAIHVVDCSAIEITLSCLHVARVQVQPVHCTAVVSRAVDEVHKSRLRTPSAVLGLLDGLPCAQFTLGNYRQSRHDNVDWLQFSEAWPRVPYIGWYLDHTGLASLDQVSTDYEESYTA